MPRNTWSGLTEEQNKQWKTWEQKYVPDMGKADTIAGEIIRAMDRLIYRWFNDGDRVGVGYGNITCNSSDRFISSVIPSRFYRNMDNESISDSEYEAMLMDNHVSVYEYLTGVGQCEFSAKNGFDSRKPNDEDIKESWSITKT